MRLVVAEKPSVARDIARVLGIRGRGNGYLGTGDLRVTWCVGHLVELAEPAAYDPQWRAWRLESLPMLPGAFELKPRKSSADQWRIVRELMRDRGVAEVVNACDAGREGELIFAYAYELAGCKAPVQRLWISSMTDVAIRQGFDTLRPASHFANLQAAARCRSEADWLVGLNATRAMTTKHRTGHGHGALLSVGRVQTPTLALLARRESDIDAFEPRDFWQVKVRFAAADEKGEYEAVWTRKGKTKDEADRTYDKAEAEAVLARIDGRDGLVSKVTRKQTREKHPLLYDLTTLQKEANKRFGYSAKKTLELAQALYETHKVMTYPRTDSRHLSSDQVDTLPRVLKGLAFGPYQAAAQSVVDRWPVKMTKRVVDDSEVSDHHALLPTGQDPRRARLSVEEKRVFDLVARRFLSVFAGDAVFATAAIETTVDSEGDAKPDMFAARGRTCLDPGWRAIDPPHSKKKELLLPPVDKGETVGQVSNRLHQGRTKPPKRFTEASLLSAMEHAGEAIDDAELKRAMKRNGLGTPATRASIIETLLTRGFVNRDGKNLFATQYGRTVVTSIPTEALTSPRLTGSWEARLVAMAEGEETREAFMADIRRFTADAVQAIRAAPLDQATVAKLAPPPPDGEAIGTCPRCQKEVRTGKRGWGCVECALYIPSQFARRTVSKQMAKTLLKDGTTAVLKGFKSRAGKDFSAALAFDDTGAVRFKFPDPDPLGDCPACGKPVRRRGKIATCDTGRECPFVVFAEMSGVEPTDDDIRALLTNQPSRLQWRNNRVVVQQPQSRERGGPQNRAPGPPQERGGPPRDGPPPHGELRAGPGNGPPPTRDTREVAGHIAPCPTCGASVAFRGKRWACQSCRFGIDAELGGRAFTAPEIAQLITTGRTDRLHGFRQKTGAVFKAAVTLGANGKLSWDFHKPDDEPDDDRISCPICVHQAQPHPGHAIRGRAAWGCSRWREGCRLRIPFTIEGVTLPDDQLRRLLGKHHATKYLKGFEGRKRTARVRLDPDADPCWAVQEKAAQKRKAKPKAAKPKTTKPKKA